MNGRYKVHVELKENKCFSLGSRESLKHARLLFNVNLVLGYFKCT